MAQKTRRTGFEHGACCWRCDELASDLKSTAAAKNGVSRLLPDLSVSRSQHKWNTHRAPVRHLALEALLSGEPLRARVACETRLSDLPSAKLIKVIIVFCMVKIIFEPLCCLGSVIYLLIPSGASCGRSGVGQRMGRPVAAEPLATKLPRCACPLVGAATAAMALASKNPRSFAAAPRSRGRAARYKTPPDRVPPVGAATAAKALASKNPRPFAAAPRSRGKAARYKTPPKRVPPCRSGDSREGVGQQKPRPIRGCATKSRQSRSLQNSPEARKRRAP
jgi:hypothetical protein